VYASYSFQRNIEKIRAQQSANNVMGDDHQVVLNSLELDNDRSESFYYVDIAFSARIPNV
jgi:hypothetical protein